jgi:thioester reductase-like protein
MPIKERYEGKRILITGTTGFLGKVLLEKFLYSLSCVDKIYVLIRAKEGSNLLERFKKEIVSSRCFDRIRLQHKGRFDEFIQQKVQPMYASPHSARATSKRRVWDSRRRSSRNCAAAAT